MNNPGSNLAKAFPNDLDLWPLLNFGGVQGPFQNALCAPGAQGPPEFEVRGIPEQMQEGLLLALGRYGLVGHCKAAGATISWELRNIYHHHQESKKRESSEANSRSIHPYGR